MGVEVEAQRVAAPSTLNDSDTSSQVAALVANHNGSHDPQPRDDALVADIHAHLAGRLPGCPTSSSSSTTLPLTAGRQGRPQGATGTGGGGPRYVVGSADFPSGAPSTVWRWHQA
jgi:hypothetical protein